MNYNYNDAEYAEYYEARRMHIRLLRDMGLTYEAIGYRLGICRERVYQILHKVQK